MYSSDSDIHALLQELWPSIMAYIHTNPIHQHSIQWKTWISQGLHYTSSLNQVKTIMGIETISQLYLILRDSEAVNTTYNINWDHEIQYSRKVTEEADHNFKAIKYEPDNHATKHTVITMSDMDEEFSVLHRKLFNIVQQWASTNQTTQNDMFIQWKKWTFSGLKPIMSAKKIKQIMGVNDVLEYVAHMTLYQPVAESFYIQQDTDTGTVTYWNRNNTENDSTKPYNEYLDHFQHIFDIRTFNMNQQMEDLQQKVAACENTQKNHFANMRHTTQQITTSIINESITTLKTTIETTVKQNLAAFEENLNLMVDEMIQDVYAAADDANKQMQILLEKKKKELDDFLSSSQTNIPGNPSQHETSQKQPRFNVTLDPHFKKSPNPFDTMASLPNTNFRRSPNFTQYPPPQDQFCTTIPTTVHVDYDKLPVVNHDQAMKRAKIIFTGLEDMFVFYNQLLNGMEQFGIYLIPLQSVVYRKSLCPEKVNNIPITPWRKQAMASSLYQKLQSTDVIPMDYTAIRNIINRFAEHNNGYEVLYAMLELVHSALQKDAVILPPKSHECDDDIHLYYQNFDAWLRYEMYANWPYSPREQVNHFIRN